MGNKCSSCCSCACCKNGNKSHGHISSAGSVYSKRFANFSWKKKNENIWYVCLGAMSLIIKKNINSSQTDNLILKNLIVCLAWLKCLPIWRWRYFEHFWHLFKKFHCNFVTDAKLLFQINFMKCMMRMKKKKMLRLFGISDDSKWHRTHTHVSATNPN